MNDHVWDLILKKEVTIWQEVTFSAGSVRGCLLGFSKYVQQLTLAAGPPAPVIIELDGMLRYEAVATIAYVLNQKLKLRDHQGRYSLTHTINGANSDPYPVHFRWKMILHRMNSNYNGGSNQLQLGNHKTETELDSGVWIAIPFHKVTVVDNPAFDFLLMVEIARRKCVDPHRDVSEKFGELPIAFCVAVGTLLVKAGLITLDSLCEVFKGDSRMEHARGLLALALSHLSLGKVSIVVSEFYQLHCCEDASALLYR